MARQTNGRYQGSFPSGGAPASPVGGQQPVQSYAPEGQNYGAGGQVYASTGPTYAPEEKSRKKINGWKVFDILVLVGVLAGVLTYSALRWAVPWWNEQLGMPNVATVKLTKAAVEAAEQSGKPVILPMDAVQATNDVTTAPAFKIRSKTDGMVKAEIPVVQPTAGTVAMLIESGKPASIVTTSVMTENGIMATLLCDTIVKVVDNSKVFADVPETAWYYEPVTFVTARELLSGTADEFFSPEMPTTRAMLMVALARLDGVDTNGGATWYEKATNWAIERGISDGSNPNGEVTREQLASMLWRYMGSPANTTVLSGFTDTAQISGYAQDAMRWAVSNGLMSGYDDGRLAPQSQATRAQVAKILENLVLNLM